MTLIEKFAATTASLEDLSESAARLNDALRVTDAPAEVLGAVEEKLHPRDVGSPRADAL